MLVRAILSSYKSRAAICQIRMHVSFAIKRVVESCFCPLFVSFSKPVSFSVKCDKVLAFCLMCGRYLVAIITPIYSPTSSYQWPFSSVFFPGLCFFCQCPIYFPPYPQLLTETGCSMFTSFQKPACNQIYYIFPFIHSRVSLLGFQKYQILSLPVN